MPCTLRVGQLAQCPAHRSLGSVVQEQVDGAATVTSDDEVEDSAPKVDASDVVMETQEDEQVIEDSNPAPDDIIDVTTEADEDLRDTTQPVAAPNVLTDTPSKALCKDGPQNKSGGFCNAAQSVWQ